MRAPLIFLLLALLFLRVGAPTEVDDAAWIVAWASGVWVVGLLVMQLATRGIAQSLRDVGARLFATAAMIDDAPGTWADRVRAAEREGVDG